jgi:peptidoglycan hydrolase-like protein with peptidoglycan-binding domain
MGLFCCYSGTRCERGPFVADGAEPDDALAFPISIGKAVGLGAPNDPDDVRTIQQALNRFPESMGGPKPKLKPDGIVGRLTAGAIEKFQRRQLGFTDQKIDPDKRTINRINELESTVWVTVPDRTMKKVYEIIVREARARALAADAALLSARLAFLSRRTIGPTPPALTMINRHFQLDKNPNAARDFEMISVLFRNMLALLSRNEGGFEKTFVPAPGRFSAARMLTSGVLALSQSNGVNMKGGQKAKAQDGSDIVVPDDKVMIMVPFTFASLDSQIITVIHELGHFLGDPDGSPNMIDDPPSRSSAPSEIAKMPPQKRPRLAECYATFAFEARFRREPIRFLA